MKSLVSALAISLSVFAGSASAATKHIHAWDIGGTGSNFRSEITLSNTCGNKTANITLRFWQNDGTPFANRNIYLFNPGSNVLTTDSNGTVTFDIGPRERIITQLTYALISGRHWGHARVTTSYDEPGTKCIVGGYNIFTSNSGYGFQSYHINNGNRF